MAALVKFNNFWLLNRLTSSTQVAIRYRHRQRGETRPLDISWVTPIVERHKKIQSGEINMNPEPAQLHLIWRVKELKGRPYWEKDIIKQMGLEEKLFKRQVVKNTPQVNAKLKAVKHLIKIVPISFPYGLPENESDYEHCYLKDNGEFVVRKKVEPLPEDVKVDPQPAESVWKMDKKTEEKQCVQKMQNYDLNAEYHTPKYVYRHNQDGKEWRYHGDKSMGGKRDWF